MKSTVINLLSASLLIGTITFASSCKKEEDDTDGNNGGSTTTEIIACTDYNAANFNSEATSSDNDLCTYVKTTMYEITHHAEFNEDGNDWDNLINTKADLILKIKEEGATDWIFESDAMNNHDHDQAAQWSAPNAEVLKNKNYEWELYDDETLTGDELMASGVFNPHDNTNSNNEIITTSTDANGLETQLKIYYFIQ